MGLDGEEKRADGGMRQTIVVVDEQTMQKENAGGRASKVFFFAVDFYSVAF